MTTDKETRADKHVHVINELDRRNLQERRNDGNVAHVFGLLLKGYMRGLELRGEPFTDTNAVDVMGLLETAKGVFEPSFDQEMRKLSLTMTRAYFTDLPSPAPETAPRDGKQLFNEMLAYYKGDISQLEGSDYPEHWTMREAKIYSDFVRKLEKHAGRPISRMSESPAPVDAYAAMANSEQVKVKDEIAHIAPEFPRHVAPLNPVHDWRMDELPTSDPEQGDPMDTPLMRAITSDYDQKLRAIQQGRGPDGFDLAARQMAQTIREDRTGEGARTPKYSAPLPYSGEDNKPDNAA